MVKYMINKIVIFGAQGMLGNYLCKYLSKYYTVIPVTRKEYDIMTCSLNFLETLFKQWGVDEDTLIINAAGTIPQAGKDKTLNDRIYLKVNTIWPHKLSFVASKFKAHMIHSSTDCVFNGNRGKYTEDDVPDETNIYGISKAAGEPENCTVIRTSIIGEEEFNKRSLLEWVKSNKNKEISGYTNHMWNGITCLEYARMVFYVVCNNLLWIGVRHIYSPRDVSKYELVSIINDVYQLNIVVKPVKGKVAEGVDMCDKTLRSKHPSLYWVPDLNRQIVELKEVSHHFDS